MGSAGGRSLQKCATCPGRNGEESALGEHHELDLDSLVRSCGDVIDGFSTPGATRELEELAIVPLCARDVDLNSDDDLFGGDIEVTTIPFNPHDTGAAKAFYRSRNRWLADRYGSSTGEITARVLVATGVALVWNTACCLMLLYVSLLHDVNGDGTPTGSPVLVIVVAPLIAIGAVLTLSVALEWQKICMDRRQRSRAPAVLSRGDAEGIASLPPAPSHVYAYG